MYMRTELPPLCGRDHLSFRSYYYPVRVSQHCFIYASVCAIVAAGDIVFLGCLVVCVYLHICVHTQVESVFVQLAVDFWFYTAF